MTSTLKNNVKLNYRYRDAGNYKQYAEAIFSNPENLPVNEIEKEIKSKLIDGEFFEPKKWGLTSPAFESWDDDLDHFWNEFVSIQNTDEEHTMNRSIKKFLQDIK